MSDGGGRTVGISHAGCPEDAQRLARLILGGGNPPAELMIVEHEPVTGSYLGPGALALYYEGDESVASKISSAYIKLLKQRRGSFKRFSQNINKQSPRHYKGADFGFGLRRPSSDALYNCAKAYICFVLFKKTPLYQAGTGLVISSYQSSTSFAWFNITLICSSPKGSAQGREDKALLLI